jgi:hypothetical protein
VTFDEMLPGLWTHRHQSLVRSRSWPRPISDWNPAIAVPQRKPFGIAPPEGDVAAGAAKGSQREPANRQAATIDDRHGVLKLTNILSKSNCSGQCSAPHRQPPV